MNIIQLREKANNLPYNPGVYIMKDKDGVIIYVGKAKKLKNRVTSYFRGNHLPKVEAMIEKISDFEVIYVKSEFEALILENSLIKKYQPHYNILLKDDKGYPFIKLSVKSLYPRFSIVSKRENDGNEYYGPFGGRGVTKEIITVILQALGLPDCTRKFPDSIGKERPCINYKIGICDGWCVENKQEEYNSRINQAAMILNGNSKALIEELTAKMYDASENQNYEYAALLRDRIKSIENLNNKERVTKNGSDKYFISQKTEDNSQRRDKTLFLLNKLSSMLNLNCQLHRIEAYDVSNLGDTGIVSAMTVFVDGQPSKKDYRKFRIKDIEIRDDYTSMYQTIFRRFSRYKNNDSKFNQYPDIILIDGGSTHASIAEKALNELELSVPVFGMVKDNHHHTRALITSAGQEISISNDLMLFSFIGKIQEETHRFAITYQKSLRYENYGSQLDEIPGVGQKRKSDLLRHFKTIKEIKNADINELKKIVPENIANNIIEYFRGK